MHYTCRWCDFEKEEPHMTREVMREIFDHEKTHPEHYEPFKEPDD